MGHYTASMKRVREIGKRLEGAKTTMTLDEKEAFRKIWMLVTGAESEFTELRLASGLDKLRAAAVRCQTFANKVGLNNESEGT